MIAIYGSLRQQGNEKALLNLFNILSRHTDCICVAREFAEHLASLGINVEQFGEVVDEFPVGAETVVSIGGDGTFLNAAAWVCGAETPIIGLNTGHLGFLASYSLNEIEALAEVICKKTGRVERRLLLRAECSAFSPDFWPCALNEVAIVKSLSTSMVTVRAYVNSRFLADYRADGLVISTPTGSTAYNLSVGGPIIAPELDCIAISPIAPHSLTARPLVIGGGSRIDLEIFSRTEQCHIALDGRSLRYPCRNAAELDSLPTPRADQAPAHPDLTISVAPFKVNVLRRPESNFASLLRDKLLWSEQ